MNRCKASLCEAGFNRYMVECEFSIGFFCDNKSDGFNRYMVECESIGLPINFSGKMGFNRYMVECESKLLA